LQAKGSNNSKQEGHSGSSSSSGHSSGANKEDMDRMRKEVDMLLGRDDSGTEIPRKEAGLRIRINLMRIQIRMRIRIQFWIQGFDDQKLKQI
jgi:hypothetical protein